jgi:hypothetical protein
MLNIHINIHKISDNEMKNKKNKEINHLLYFHADTLVMWT